MVDNIQINSGQSSYINDVSSKYITMSPSAKKEAKNDSVEITKTQQTAEDETTTQQPPEKPKKSKSSKIAAGALIGAAAITIIEVFSNSKGWNKKLNKLLKDFAEKHTKDLNLTKAKTAYTKGNKNSKLVKATNILNNFTSFKDCYFLPFFEHIPGLRWMSNKSSKLYETTGIAMTKKAYQKAFSSNKGFETGVKNLLKTLGDSELTEEINTLMGKREKLFNRKFDPKMVDERFKDIVEKMDNNGGICKRTRDHFTGLLKKLLHKNERKEGLKGFTEFVAEDILAKDKQKFILPLKNSRNQIKKLDTEIIDLIKAKHGEEVVEDLIKKQTGAAKSLKKAVMTEGNDLFDKMRDIKIGCAPTDVGGIALTTGLLGVYLSQAQDKDQRVEVAMTTGVPLGLGMISSTIATMKMLTGFKALGLGALTTLVSGQIGKMLNNAYKSKHGGNDKKPEIFTLDNYLDELKKKAGDKIKNAPPDDNTKERVS